MLFVGGPMHLEKHMVDASLEHVDCMRMKEEYLNFYAQDIILDPMDTITERYSYIRYWKVMVPSCNSDKDKAIKFISKYQLLLEGNDHASNPRTDP